MRGSSVEGSPGLSCTALQARVLFRRLPRPVPLCCWVPASHPWYSSDRWVGVAALCSCSFRAGCRGCRGWPLPDLEPHYRRGRTTGVGPLSRVAPASLSGDGWLGTMKPERLIAPACFFSPAIWGTCPSGLMESWMESPKYPEAPPWFLFGKAYPRHIQKFQKSGSGKPLPSPGFPGALKSIEIQ